MCTVEPVLKDHPMGHTDVVSQDRWFLATGSITLECGTFIPGVSCLSRQVVSHGSGLSRQVLLYLDLRPFLHLVT